MNNLHEEKGNFLKLCLTIEGNILSLVLGAGCTVTLKKNMFTMEGNFFLSISRAMGWVYIPYNIV